VRRIACLLGALAAPVVALGLARRLAAYRIEDHSMEPALQPGDWVLGVRRRHARRGEVVVFDHPQRPGFEMVKRVAAPPGETVDETALGPGGLWVLGDNPAAGSVDSRRLGPIPLERLRARLLWRYRPWPPTRVR
jgi:signal peptidase I